jgi:hypothetical protein
MSVKRVKKWLKGQNVIREHFSLRVVLFSVLLVFLGFWIGRYFSERCSPSVLGVQNPQYLSSRILALSRFIQESNSVNPGLRLSPESQTDIVIIPENTQAPTPEPTKSDSTLIWSGLHRNSEPTETSKPTAIYFSPTPVENTDSDRLHESPTASPTTAHYRANWDRGVPSATPTMFEVPLDKIDDNSEKKEESSKKNHFQPTPTITVVQNKFSTNQIGKIIDQIGVSLERTSVSTNTDKEGISVNGVLKDKLFGFLPVQYPIEIRVDESNGQIDDISIPWWRSLFGNPFIGNISRIVCGDGICSVSESFDSCKIDCTPVCGNAICEYGEGQDTCPLDCGGIISPEPTITVGL